MISPESEALLFAPILERKSKRRQENAFAKILGIVFSTDNMFWEEKAFLLIDFFQILGFLWSAPFELPYWFYYRFRFTLIFNFDFVARRDTSQLNSLWPDTYSTITESGTSYLWFWLFLPYILIIPPWLYCRLKDHSRRIIYDFERLLYCISHLLYLPYCMHVLRYLFCGNFTGHYSFTCNYTCNNADSHSDCLSRTIAPILFSSPFIFGFPIALFRLASKNVVHSTKSDHESFLQTAELEQVLGLSNDHKVWRLWVVSPFLRRASRARPLFFVQKLLLVVLLCAINRENYLGTNKNVWTEADWYRQALAALFLGVLFIPPVICIARSFFRLASSNFTFMLCAITLSIDTLFGYLSASKIRSPLLVDSVAYVWLMFFNLFCICVLVISLLLWIRRPARFHWPVTKISSKKTTEGYEHFVECVHHANELVRHAVESPPELVRCTALAKHIFSVQRNLVSALADDHPLAPTIQNSLDRLIHHYHMCHTKSIAHVPGLLRELKTLKTKLDARSADFVLFHPSKQKILLKVLAVNAFSDLKSGKLRIKSRNSQSGEDLEFPLPPPGKSLFIHDEDNDHGWKQAQEDTNSSGGGSGSSSARYSAGTDGGQKKEEEEEDWEPGLSWGMKRFAGETIGFSRSLDLLDAKENYWKR